MRLRKLSTKIVVALWVLVMGLAIIPISTLQVAAETEAKLTISTVSTMPGETVELVATFENTPAVKSIAISDIVYDTSKMTLTAVEWLCDAEIKNWNSSQGRGVLTFGENTDANGPVLKMTFKINDAVEDSDVSVSCSIILKTMNTDGDEVPVATTVIPGKVEIRNEIPGDMDSNKKVNSDDAVYLLYHTLFGKEEYPIKQGGDIDGNGKTDSNDAVYLLYYVLFGEEDYPLHGNCVHSLIYFAEQPASCTEVGNIAYWTCSSCGKHFSDANAATEISILDTVISASGHTEVIDEAVSPTYDNTGLTEGLHCFVCNEVLQEQQVVPKLEPEYYSITYSNLQGAAYPELTEYASHLGVSRENMPKPERTGYKFEGWFTALDGGTKISDIPTGSTQNYELYAGWTLIEYQITYYCGNGVNSTNNISSYDVNTAFTFAGASLKGCVFYRWVDENGNTVTKIEKGSTGDLILTAEYREMRYLTVPIDQIVAPIYDNEVAFAEYDSTNNVYTYVYYLGYVSDVPLTQPSGVAYNGTGDISGSLTATSATETSIEKGISSSQSYTISTEISSNITVKEETEIPSSKVSVEASISASLGTSETISESASISKAKTESEELSRTASFTLPDDSPYGYYRIIYKGILDMFVAVVYDPAKDKLDVVEYSVLRDGATFALDYSQSADFGGHVPDEFDFVIPTKVQDHILYLSEGSAGFVPQPKGNECSIIGYNGTDTDIIIPTYLNGRKVTSIDAALFAANTSITSITFGEGITSIPAGAFEGCTSLKSVVFNGNLTEIGANAFEGCAALEFEIPDTVTNIGDAAFDGCEAIDDVTISNPVASLGMAVFNNCGELSLAVNSSDLSRVQAAISSGATSVYIDWMYSESAVDANCMLTVPAIQTFKFDGNLQAFNNLYIVSNAADTTIESVTINKTAGENALTFSSSNVDLRDIAVDSNKTALVLSADSVNLSIGGAVKLTANNGCNGLTANNLIISSAAGEGATFEVTGGAGSPGGCGMKIANKVIFEGYLTSTVTGGEGSKGTATGSSGSDGGVAIYAKTVTINTVRPISAVGGRGGDGAQGAIGSTGSNLHGGDSKRAGTGGTGGTGGKGGAGGWAINPDCAIVANNGQLIINNGSGGTGGKGGTGGTGGHAYYGDFMNAYCGRGGHGGTGGTGGQGGDNPYTDAQRFGNNVIVYNGSSVGGAGGTGGNPGGTNSNSHDGGSKGADGSDGKAGIYIYG